jgi:hypothetical protein
LVLFALPPVKAAAVVLAVRPEVAASPSVVVKPVANESLAVMKDETEICRDDCSGFADVAGAGGVVAGGRQSAAVLQVTRLGYRPKMLGVATTFDHETTVTFLSSRELLLTFDPHRLRERTGEAWHAGSRRLVRAVLIDAQTRRVTRVVDWQVDGDGQYLWPAGSGHVLVHMHGGLQLLGEGLVEEANYPVQGELLWVTASPSGARIALAMVRERHNERTHALIAEQSGMRPEEDVELRVMDREGHVLVHREGSSAMIVPVLTDGGEAIVQGAGPRRWQIEERTPEGVRLRVVAKVTSGCRPRLSAPAHDVLMVEGCTALRQRWFRVVQGDGHTLLKSRETMTEIEPQAVLGGSALAVGVVELKQSSGAGDVIVPAQLGSQRVEVHRLGDGKSLLATVTEDYPPSRQAYALSPDDRWLAVMTQSHVAIYSVNRARSFSR